MRNSNSSNVQEVIRLNSFSWNRPFLYIQFGLMKLDFFFCRYPYFADKRIGWVYRYIYIYWFYTWTNDLSSGDFFLFAKTRKRRREKNGLGTAVDNDQKACYTVLANKLKRRFAFHFFFLAFFICGRIPFRSFFLCLKWIMDWTQERTFSYTI